MIASVGLLAIGMVIRLDAAEDVTPADAWALMTQLGAAIEQRTEREVSLEDPIWSAENAAPGGTDVLRLRLIAAITTIRVIAVLHSIDGDQIRGEVDLPSARAKWGAPLALLAERLFPDARPTVAPPLVATSSSAIETPSIGPYVLIGVGLTAVAAGIGFGFASRDARNASQDPTLDDAAFDRLADRTQGFAWAANSLYVVSALGAIGGLIWWWLE